MKKAINLFRWIAVTFTVLALVLTLLTSYQFIYIKYFDSYYTLEWSMFFTMLLFGISMFDYKHRLKNIVYSLCCMILAAGTMFFIYMKVY
ncbi:MAG: hypothetical protein ACM3X7_13100 [Solirubrobacterales bacterium]